MANPNDRVFELVRQYRYNPQLFTEQQTDELQELAYQANVPFKRKTDDINLRNIAEQLTGGFLEGFTTIPVNKLGGQAPKTVYESIAHSLGHLAGFAPGIIAGPLSMGAKGMARLGGKKLTESELQRKASESALGKAADLAGKANHWSVPMMFGDKAKDVMDAGLRKSKLESLDFMKKGAKTKAILDQAVHLGAASAMSTIWKGPDAIIDAGFSGAVAGGAFGGLGEIRAIGNYLKSSNKRDYRKGEQRIKAAVGAAMLGLPTAMQEEPIEMILYQTLLGGYFGYGARPRMEVEGGKFIRDLRFADDNKYIFKPGEHPDFGNYSKGAQEYIRKESTEQAKTWLDNVIYKGSNVDARMEVEDILRKKNNLKDSDPLTQEQINTGLRDLANQKYTAKRKDYEEFVLRKEVSDMMNNLQKTESTDVPDLNKENNKNSIEADKRSKEREIFGVVEQRDPDGNVTTKILGGLELDKIGFKGSYDKFNVVERYENKPMDEIMGQEYLFFNQIFVKEPVYRSVKRGDKWTRELVKDKKGQTVYSVNKIKPIEYDVKTDNFLQKGESSSKISKKTLWGIEVDLDKSGRYLYGGVKDKGIYTVGQYHKDINNYKLEDILRSLVSEKTPRQEVNEIYLASLKEWMSRYPDADRTYLKTMHDRAWKSNVLTSSQLHGFLTKDLTGVNKLMQPGFVKNVIDWNKREQLWQDRSSPLPKGTLGGSIPFVVAKDVLGGRYQLDTGEFKRHDSDHDGTIYFYRNDKAGINDIKTMQEALGLPGDVNMNKPVVVATLPGYGTMALKAAGAGAPKEIQRFMDKSGVRMVIMRSAAKHTGGVKEYEFDRNLLEKGIYELTEPFVRDSNMKIKETDIRINTGTYENPAKFTKGSKIVRQLATNLSNYLAPDAMDILWKDVYLKSIKGKAEVNDLADKYLKGEKVNLKDIDVNNLSVEKIHDIFVNHGHTELAKKIAKDIVKMDKAGELEDIDTFSESEYQQYIYRNNRILQLSDLSQSQREMGLFSREFFENNYKKYLINRYVSPHYRESAKVWLAPRHPHDVVQDNVKFGEFMIGRDGKNMKVIYEGKPTTLGKAWAKAKKNNKSSDFDFLVVRVPADSISGTRALKFAGFTKEKGISITTNAKDNMYLGGADKDSDTAFLYQNMPKEVVSKIKEKTNEWEKNGKWIDSKKEDKLFESLTDDAYKSPISQFSPSFRRTVAETAAKGQAAIGYGVVGKTNLLDYADYLHSKGGSEVIPLISKGGRKYGEIRIKLKPNGQTHEILSRLGREILNRSADAANYSNMLDYAKFRDLLVKEGFDTQFITYNKKTNAPKNTGAVSYAKLEANSRLKDIAQATRLSKHKNSKNLDLLFEQLNNLDAEALESIKGLTGKAMKKMKEDNLDTRFITEEIVTDYVEVLKRFKNQINLLEKQDPIYMKINQMQYRGDIKGDAFKRMLNPENALRDIQNNKWSEARVKMERDMKIISSWNALNKKGFAVHKGLKDMGVFKDVDSAVDKILKPIAKQATLIKQKQDNRHLDNMENSDLNHKIEFNYDMEVGSYKNVLSAKAKEYNKKFGSNNLITEKMLHDYFEQWLLSPFYHNATEVKGTKYKFDSPIIRHTKHAYQSQKVDNDSIRFLLREQDAIFEEIRITPKGETVDVPKLTNVANSLQPAPEVVTYKKRIYENDTDFLRSRAINKKEYKEVLDFENTLKNNKVVKDNLSDFYENFLIEVKGTARRDLDLITMEDIIAMNRYLKDMDMRTKPNGFKLPNFAWRASPEYMDLYMRNFEERFFQSSLENVKTRDGIVLREVKKYTSTLGEMKDFLNKAISKMESQSNNVPKYNDLRYPHRSLPTKEASIINDLVVDAIQGVNYKLRPEYIERQNKVYKDYFNGKDYTIDKVIKDTQERYKKDFLQFSETFIHAKDSKGNFMTGLKDSDGKWKEKNLWSEIDKKNKYGTYNDLLKWKSDGRFDMKNFNDKVFNEIRKGKDIPKMQLETVYRAIYEMQVEGLINQTAKHSKLSRQQLRENFRAGKILDPKLKDRKDIPIKGFRFTNVGRKNLDAYFPHTNFGRNKRTQKEIEDYTNQRYEELLNTKGKKVAELYRLKGDLFVDKSQSTDGGSATSSIENIMVDYNKIRVSDLEKLGLNTRPQSVYRRSPEEFPGYDRSEYAIDIYKQQIINGLYKNMISLHANKTINDFVKRNAFGDKTNDWALYLRSYARDSLGLPSVFGDRLGEFITADTSFKRRGVYLLSDEAAIKGFEKVEKMFKKHGREMPFTKNITKAPDKRLLNSKDPIDQELYWAQHNKRMNDLTTRIHNFGRWEAKFQLWTLLGHTKIWAGNLFGGTTNTITRGGLKNFARANNKKFIEKHIIRDLEGNYALKFESGKEVKTMKDLQGWMGEKGVIESFIANELNLNMSFKDVKGNTKHNLKDFSKELAQKLKGDPELSQDAILDIARKYRVDKLIDTSAAFFMQSSERKLRRDAFLTHAIEYMEHFGKDGYKLTLNDPAVFEAGLRGVEATQYLYHSAFRPGYMRTALGKTLSRFKLFVFNSVRIRKEMLRKANYYGFKEGTKEFEKFKTDFAINMFVMALGTAFQFSLFDTTLPPPYDWIQESGDWLFGDKKTRDTAFFGQYPYPIAPLNIVTPPLARIPMAAFSSLINKDWERFFDYHAYTMFPFGRMIRSIDKTIDEPYGTIEGRAMQQFFGIPLDKVRDKIDRAQVLKARKEMINREMEEL